MNILTMTTWSTINDSSPRHRRSKRRRILVQPWQACTQLQVLSHTSNQSNKGQSASSAFLDVGKVDLTKLGWHYIFLAVQNSSIGDLVPCLLCLTLTPLTIRVFTTLQSEPSDLWPLRHLIRVTRKHDLTKKKFGPPPKKTVKKSEMKKMALTRRLF